MYSIILESGDNKYELEELIKVFLKPSEYEITISPGEKRDKIERERELYRYLSGLTGKTCDWGILTGVRPVKLTGELFRKLGARQPVRDKLTEEYLLSGEKAELLLSVYEYQRGILGEPAKGMAGVYVGIPFCPTRCLYCSFTSNQAGEPEISEYLKALFREIEFTEHEMKEAGLTPETLYIGGGTPTVLQAGVLESFLSKVRENLDLSQLAEFSIEAGRPDTITPEKLKVIRDAGATRISINPQSMNERTLGLIGRRHSPDDVRKAVAAARDERIGIINMDVIAGLPGESPGDFIDTVAQVIDLGAENITVHTLAVKRASRLIDVDRDYHYGMGDTVREMLERCREALKAAGYIPYYLYRQKHMAGGFENIGWCLPGTAGIYNIRAMEESQTIVALGAGGISKAYYPEENRLERVPNVSNYEQYIVRIEEMLGRKREKLFYKERELC